MVKLDSEQFNELQRWIEVRDSCQKALAELRQATDYANAHNYDNLEYFNATKFISDLENKAIDKIGNFIKQGDVNKRTNICGKFEIGDIVRVKRVVLGQSNIKGKVTDIWESKRYRIRTDGWLNLLLLEEDLEKL